MLSSVPGEVDMETSLLLRTYSAEKPVQTQIAELVLDASLEEASSMKSKVTKYPVENGSIISDHIVNEPVEVTIKGFVSNHPIIPSDTVSLTTAPVLKRASAAYFDLLSIRSKRQPVTIITGLDVFRNMVMESLEIPRSAQTGDSLEFTASFTQITIVSSSTIPAEYIKDTVKHTASKVDGGNKTPKDPNEDQKKKAKSVLKHIKDAIENPFIKKD
jgi:hypothetical protein